MKKIDFLPICFKWHTARTYLQLPLWQWGAGNVYLLSSVVQLKSKHCQKPHCRNGVVDMFGQYLNSMDITFWVLCILGMYVLYILYNVLYVHFICRYLFYERYQSFLPGIHWAMCAWVHHAFHTFLWLNHFVITQLRC